MSKPAPADHAIHPFLRDRWSPRAFADTPVPTDGVFRLLEAARWAPSSNNEQPWAFLVATADQPAEFARALECLVEFNRTWASKAPLLILTVAHRVFTAKSTPNAHAWHDVGLAVGNLTTQASAEGLSIHQMAGILPDRVRELYGVPADWDAVTALAIGYAGDPASLSEQLRQRELAPRVRKPLSEFVFTGAWGQAHRYGPSRS